MPEFGRKKSNVVRGQFRRGSERKWMSPDDYERLSPAEKHELWKERKLDRARAQYQRRAQPRRRRMPRWKEKLIFSGVIAAIMGVTWLNDQFSAWTGGSGPATLASVPGETVEGRSFGLCVWGGGENCVVDGDTFYLDGAKIRIAGIDAPETHDYKCPSEKALGDRATERLQQLLNSGPLALSSIDRDEDVYGRKLRNVAVGGADVGDTLISDGLAREYLGHKMSWC